MRHRVGIAGYGAWAKIVVRYIESDPFFELARICGPRLAREGIFTHSYDDLLTDPSIGSIYIAAPIPAHVDLARAALLAGKNVLCEKPLSLDSGEAAELSAIAMERGLALETNYTWLYSRGTSKLKELLPRLGEISFVELRLRQLGRFYADSVYEVLACHMLALVDHLFSLEGMSVASQCLMRGPGGVVETAEIPFTRGSLQGRIFTSLNSADRERRISIYGSKGQIVFNPLSPESLTLVLSEREGADARVSATEVYPSDEGENLRLMLRHLEEVVTGRREDNRNLSGRVTAVLSNIMHNEVATRSLGIG